MENNEKPLKTKSAWNNALINLSICLTDIPKNKIKKAKNGKLYVAITIKPRKEPDQFGQDCYAVIAQTKEEREAKTDLIYVANGDFVSFSAQNESVAEMTAATDEDYHDLPF